MHARLAIFYLFNTGCSGSEASVIYVYARWSTSHGSWRYLPSLLGSASGCFVPALTFAIFLML